MINQELTALQAELDALIKECKQLKEAHSLLRLNIRALAEKYHNCAENCFNDDDIFHIYDNCSLSIQHLLHKS